LLQLQTNSSISFITSIYKRRKRKLLNWKTFFRKGSREWNRAVVVWVALGTGLSSNLFSLYLLFRIWLTPQRFLLVGEPDSVILGAELFLATVFVGLSVLGLIYYRKTLRQFKKKKPIVFDEAEVHYTLRTHKLSRFSDFVVFCSICEKEFFSKNPEGVRLFPYSSEKKLPVLTNICEGKRSLKK
jgi:hypothetical protein